MREIDSESSLPIGVALELPAGDYTETTSGGGNLSASVGDVEVMLSRLDGRSRIGRIRHPPDLTVNCTAPDGAHCAVLQTPTRGFLIFRFQASKSTKNSKNQQKPEPRGPAGGKIRDTMLVQLGS